MIRRFLFLCAAASVIVGCGDGVSSDEQARRAYLGLDASIDKAIQLGFDGFNDNAISGGGANIRPQTAPGAMGGTLTVTGQVDQGSSANKGMRLFEALALYSDDGKLTYDTTASAMPALNMQLKGIPTGTLDGTLIGTLNMKGELEGSVMVSITFTSMLEAGTGNVQVRRKTGTTRITGTASSGGGTYTIDVTR